MAKAAATKSAYSPEFLDKVKEVLLKDKTKFEMELGKFKGKDGDQTFPDYGDSEEDNAREVADYEANLSIENDLEKSLRDVISSLKRLEKGDYGICRYCKKAIEEKRLLARPTSSACVACKKTIIQEI
jgi:DnaK suppressor protein